MRGMMTLFSVLLTLALMPSQAEAKRYSIPNTGFGESLQFIAETDQVDPNGNPMSLCYLGEGIVLLSAQMTFEVQGYVLAENRCEADSYFELTLQQMIMGKAAGLFPADVPLVPETPADIKLRNYGFYGLIAFIIGVGLLTKLIASMGGLQAMTSKRGSALCGAARLRPFSIYGNRGWPQPNPGPRGRPPGGAVFASVGRGAYLSPAVGRGTLRPKPYQAVKASICAKFSALLIARASSCAKSPLVLHVSAMPTKGTAMRV